MSFQNNNKYHRKIYYFLSVELVSFKIFNKEYNEFFLNSVPLLKNLPTEKLARIADCLEVVRHS